MNSEQRRITELDGIRGIAALGVVIYHYHKHLGGAPLESVLFPIYRGGLLFVDLFFVLSGFILAQIYAEEARYPTFRAALVSRIARLYPLHIATLLLAAALQKIHLHLTDYCFIYVYNDWQHLLLNLFMLNESGLQRGYSFNGPAWSISTEFIVNVLFLAVALRRPGRALALGLVLVGVLFTADFLVHWTEPARPLLPFTGLFRCFMAFGMGLVLHAVHRRTPRRFNPWAVEALFIATVAGTLFFMAMPERPMSLHVLALVYFPALILLALRSTYAGGVLRSRPLVYLGQISFSLYLLHYPLELAAVNLGLALGFALPVDSPLMLLAQVALCIAASHLMWKWLEMPSRGWIKRWANVKNE